MKNNGIEITLNTTPVKIKDFRWDVNFTFTKNKNEIKKIDGQVDENGKPLDDVNNKWFVGYPMNVYYDYVFDGIWQKMTISPILICRQLLRAASNCAMSTTTIR